MKKNKLIYYSLALFLFASCKADEIREQTISESSILTVKEVKSFVDSNFAQNTTLSKKASSSGQMPDKDLPNYDFDWENSYTNSKVPAYPVIMVPLKNNNVDRAVFPDMNPKGYRIVGFQHDKDHNIWTDIFEIHPDIDYLERKMKSKGLLLTGNNFSEYDKIIDTEDFFGYVFIWSTDGTFKGAFYSKNGNYARVYDKTLKLKHKK